MSEFISDFWKLPKFVPQAVGQIQRAWQTVKLNNAVFRLCMNRGGFTW